MVQEQGHRHQAILWRAAYIYHGPRVNFITILIPRTLVGIGAAGYTSGGTPLITAAFLNA
jgi:hypothetical protein